jgi:hypothetical protein
MTKRLLSLGLALALSVDGAFTGTAATQKDPQSARLKVGSGCGTGQRAGSAARQHHHSAMNAMQHGARATKRAVHADITVAAMQGVEPLSPMQHGVTIV